MAENTLQSVNKESLPGQNSWTLLGIAWDLGYLIVLPIVIFGFAGAYADKYYSTSPLFLLIGIGLSLLITTIGVYRKMSTLIRQMNTPNDKK